MFSYMNLYCRHKFFWMPVDYIGYFGQCKQYYKRVACALK